MKSIGVLSAAIMVLLLGTGLNADEIKAKVLKVTGTVSCKAGEKGEWSPLQENAEIGKDSFIETKEKSTASLEIPGKGVIIIHELSSVALTSIDRSGQNFTVKVKMFFGTMWNRIKKNEKDEKSTLSVDAPAAVAAVRGTSFYVVSDAKTNDAKIGVWDGSVDVTGRAGPETKTVEPNFEIIVLFNKPIQDPIKMKVEEIQREREMQQNILNLGVSAMFPAARGMQEMNDMQTNQATDIVNQTGARIKGERKIDEDFKKLKKAVARLYSDTGYVPNKDLAGNPVKKGAPNSLACLLKDEDKTGAKIPNWKGPYLDSDFKDPFGGKYGAYLKKTGGGEYLMLYSPGVDKMPTTEDDVDSLYKMQDLQNDAKAEKERAK
ncbi:MAG: FecR domain-containing protein [Lentisphaerota bacterium]